MLMVVGALAVANETHAISRPSWARVEKIHSNDPLRVAPLVMEATFVRVTSGRIGHAHYLDLNLLERPNGKYAAPMENHSVPYLELEDVRVIRGERPIRRLAASALPAFRLRPGQRLIVCAYYVPDAGEYFAGFMECVLWETDQGWERESHNDAGTWFTPAELDSFFHSQSLEGVLERAPTVIEARVTATHDSTIAFAWARDGRRPVKMMLCELDDVVVLKGSEPMGPARNLAVIKSAGGYSPEWRYLAPFSLVPGDRWILFLDTEPEYGLSYPVGGKHGMLKVQGSHLIFDNKVQYPMSRMDVFSSVQRHAFLLSPPPVE
jgi:hypothetical protein